MPVLMIGEVPNLTEDVVPDRQYFPLHSAFSS